MFTLDQVRAFVVVAEELHFGRAAERLQMTQPPLSRQIQKLERAVGVRLFERDNRKVELTTAGDTFLIDARRILALASGALQQAQRIQAGSAGTVRIGFTATSTFSVLTSLLNLVSEAYPDIHLDLFEMVTREQISKLIDGELDLGLARPPFDKTAFASRLLYREDLLLAVPSGHRLSHLDRLVSAEDLGNEPLIMYSPAEARYFYDLVVRSVPDRQRERGPHREPGPDDAVARRRWARYRVRAGIRQPSRDERGDAPFDRGRACPTGRAAPALGG